MIMETALRGDPDLIRSRGGTLLPDDDPNSYVRINGVWYKCFITKNTFCGAPLIMQEFLVGNAGRPGPDFGTAAAGYPGSGGIPHQPSGRVLR